jgi:hypothetical protein
MRFDVPLAAAVLVALTLGTGIDSVRADEPRSRDERELAGHYFMPSGRILDPFVTTHARFRTAGGLATGFQAIYNVPGVDTTKNTSGDIGFFGLDFEYQQNLWERASARLSLEGNARVGVDNTSVLASGLSSAYGYELEGKYRLLRRATTLLTVHALLSHKNLFALAPLRFLEGVIKDGYDENDSIVAEGHLNRLLFGPGAAWAPKPWLGITGHGLVGPADPFDSSTGDKVAFRGAITGDVDAKQLGWWPIGFMLGYDFDSFPEADNDVVEGIHSFTFGAAYTGREDFSIGLEITNSEIKQKDLPDEFGSVMFSINSRYYF